MRSTESRVFANFQAQFILEFQIEVGGETNGEAGKFRSKQLTGRVQYTERLAKISEVNKRQVGENGEAGENTAFIEIKSSNDFVKISTKRT